MSAKVQPAPALAAKIEDIIAAANVPCAYHGERCDCGAAVGCLGFHDGPISSYKCLLDGKMRSGQCPSCQYRAALKTVLELASRLVVHVATPAALAEKVDDKDDDKPPMCPRCSHGCRVLPYVAVAHRAICSACGWRSDQRPDLADGPEPTPREYEIERDAVARPAEQYDNLDAPGYAVSDSGYSGQTIEASSPFIERITTSFALPIPLADWAKVVTAFVARVQIKLSLDDRGPICTGVLVPPRLFPVLVDALRAVQPTNPPAAVLSWGGLPPAEIHIMGEVASPADHDPRSPLAIVHLGTLPV